MHRLLIADPQNVFAGTLKEHLSNRFCIEVCYSGQEVLKSLSTFNPDVLVLDLNQPDIDGLHLLHTIRSAGFTTRIVTLTAYIADHTLSILESLGVCQVYRKPCITGNLILSLQELSFESSDIRHWCLELEADRLLFSLGFRPNGRGYLRTHEALCMKYNDPEAAITKHIYPILVKRYNGNAKQMEKLIHNTIKTAVQRGNSQLWQLYFPDLDMQTSCPGNDEFLSRMERALHSKEHFQQTDIALLEKVL